MVQRSSTILIRVVLLWPQSRDNAMYAKVLSKRRHYSTHGALVGTTRAFAIETFFKNGESVVVTHRLFRRHFNIERHGRIPERHTITNWVNKFRTTSSALDRKPGRNVKYVRTPENIERVRNAVNRSPRHSARKHASALALSRSSMGRILHSDLHYQGFTSNKMEPLYIQLGCQWEHYDHFFSIR
jgi:hypothetical protein